MIKIKTTRLYRMVVFLFITFQLSTIFLFSLPQRVEASVPFTTAYATLSNSRFSYRAGLSGNYAANTGVFTIQTSTFPDNDTGNLFPNSSATPEVVCFNGPASSNGCSGQATYTVNAIPSTTSFNISGLVPNTLKAGDYVVATQAARITMTFTPTTNIASGGYIRVSIPAAASNYADGMPDNSGFDANGLTNGNIDTYIQSLSGFTKSATSLSYSGNDHVILITLSSVLNGGTSYAFTIGDSSSALYRFINPTPAGSGHSASQLNRGVADTYTIKLETLDPGSVVQDLTNMKVAPIEGVLVSATVEMTIAYTIGSIAVSTAVCGTTTSVTSTATSIPFGSIINNDTFYDAAQSHSVTTNASNGYVLTVQEDGALSKDGGGTTTIADTTCDSAACNSTTPAAWTTPTFSGFGYTLANSTGIPVPTPITTGYRSFSTSTVQVMSSSTAVSGDKAFSCYRLAVPGTQTAGYYFNKLTYIATPKF